MRVRCAALGWSGGILFLVIGLTLAGPAASQTAPVRPILECVTEDGPSQYTAVYGYKNENAVPVTIPVGASNKFTPTPQDRGQTTVFQPGRTPYDQGAFRVPFPGTNLVWTLKGPDGKTRTSTASANSKRCPAPSLTALLPASVSLAPGGNVTLIATISAPQSGIIEIALASSDPTVASVAASVSVPPGLLSVAVPVTVFTPGNATITATLNGSGYQSVITVIPVGATLTSLLPATLQVTQGASGTLTVTIGAPQPADTVVPLTTSDPGVIAFQSGSAVTVPAGVVAVPVPVVGLWPGTATIAAGPVNGTTVQSEVTVIAPPPTIVSLAPPVLPLTEGSSGTLTVTLNASQPTEIEVTVATSDPVVVGLPAGTTASVPAGSGSVPVSVIGLSRGTATVAATLNGTSATSAVTVQAPPPTVGAVTCPSTLALGATGQCTLALNATQLSETSVSLTADPPGVLTVPASVLVPAGQLAVPVPVSGLTVGSAVLTVGPLNGTAQQAAIQILPPPPTLVGLSPNPAALLVGASTTLTLALNAAQATDTVVAVASNPTGIVTVPTSITVPAGSVTVAIPLTGVLAGTTILAAGPLNGTTVATPVTVTQLPPTVTGLAPPALTLPKGTAESLTVSIAPVQPEPTTVPLTSSDPSTVEVPATVPVPAGSATAAFPVIGRNVGAAAVTAGPLHSTTAAATVTVTAPALLTLTIAPATVFLAVGQTEAITLTGTYTDGSTQDLSGTATWTSGDEAIASVTTPGGVVTARAVGEVTVTAGIDGKTATTAVTVTPPTLTVLALAPTLPTRPVGQTVQFQVLGTYTDATTLDLTGSVTWTSSDPVVAPITSPGGLATTLSQGQTTITATHASGMTVRTTLTATGPVVVSLSIAPRNPTKTVGRDLQFAATGTYSDGSAQNVTSAVTWTSSDPTVARITASGGLATALAEGTSTITATHAAGIVASTTLTATLLPPDPILTAPPVSASATTVFAPATEFLHAGPDPVQTDVVPGTIETRRAAVLRGRVVTRDGNPLAGVTVSILDHPEYGTTLSRTDGLLDFVVNGGGQITVQYQKAGFLPAQRPVTPSWQDYAWLPEVVLIPYDTRVTTIDLTAPAAIQVARGNPVTDKDGTRQATLFFTQGTTATIQLPGGGTQPLTTLRVRATEYTVGPNGPQAMPAPLPANTGYTYAVELSVDEAVAQGVKLNGKDVLFNRPVYVYVENFLDFPVGGIVPVGYYDNTAGRWVPSDNGKIVKLLSVTGGLADLDVDGSNTPATPAALTTLGITDAERQALAILYAAGRSLWRFPVAHFSSWDANWGLGVAGGRFPNQQKPRRETPEDCPTKECGSVLELQNQTLGEAVALSGTPFHLHYRSDRVPGNTTANRLRIPASDGSVSSTLKRIELEVRVAGRKFTTTLSNAPDQTYAFIWDGQDAYGRAVQGAQPVTTRVGYTYDATYQQPATLYRSFGYNGLGLISGSRSRMEMTLWQEDRTLVGTGWDGRGHGLGGWSLDVHHAYDVGGRTLYLGDGTRRGSAEVRGIIQTIIGGGTVGEGGAPRDGVEALRVAISSPKGLAVDGRGTIYFTDGSAGVFKVTPDGIFHTVVGGGQGFSGDGGPALSARLYLPAGLALDPQGNLYIADELNNRLRRVDPAGIITTVAGGGSMPVCAGQAVPAASAHVGAPIGVAVDGQGDLFMSDTYGVLRLTADGMVTRVAGQCWTGFSGDGGPAINAKLEVFPQGIALDRQGNLYIADQRNHRIRKVGTDGLITTVAGNGSGAFCGDGGPATSACLYEPAGVAVDAQGTLFIYDMKNQRIRQVSPDGIITTVAGTGVQGYAGDGGAAVRARLGLTYLSPGSGWIPGMGLAADPQGALLIADRINARIRRVGLAYPGFSGHELVIPAEDGGELYIFDAVGRHLRTVHALTGAIRYQFGYDAQGRLLTVTDGDSNVTAILRDGGGNPTAIVAPDGQRTALTLDASGYLATITNPAGETHRFTSTAEGLLQTYATPRNHEYRFAYDSLGRLTRHLDPAAGSKAFTRTESGTNHTVALTTAMNRVSTYRVEHLVDGSTRRVDTESDGTTTQLQLNANATRMTTNPDGTVTTLREDPDPRFAMLAPLPGSLAVQLPSGLTMTRTAARTVTLSDPLNVGSLSSQTDTLTLNGRTATRTYDAATTTFTERSPANRAIATTLDTQGRVVRQQADSLEPMAFTYDPRGRLITVTQGTGGAGRTSTFTYNTEGFLATITDPLSRTVRFTYDLAGRVITQTLPDLRVVQTTYDANGNVASITPPSRPAHTLGYTPIDLEESYTPPDLGIGNVATTYTYNQDRQLTQVTRPDGQTLSLNYDPTTARLTTLTAPTGQTTFTYHPTSGQMSGVASPGGVGLSYTYDGSLLTGTTWTGPVAGSVARNFDTDFRVATESVNGSDSVTFQYDPDSLLTQAGSLTLTRHPQHGLLTGTTLGDITDALTYNTFGELATYQASHSGSPLLGVAYTRDALGRITQKVETIGGATTTTAYGYDPAGRLTDVTTDGLVTAHYEYDANGNRLSVTRPSSGTVSGTYDAQDRTTTYGAVTYTYTANGDLQTATSGGETTAYTYDAFGNLTAVALPNGTQIEYLIDGQNRRIGRRVNGLLTQAFLYGSQLRPAAELDSSGGVIARFVYGTRINVPDYLVKGGATYRLLTDPLGSVRLVVDAATGAIAQRIDYDEFGQITQDTNPGFQPFGFAGGLYDPDTKLTRFGARDYDPFTGRWTTKDPIGFASRDVNLYAYAKNRPLTETDPLGLDTYMCKRPLEVVPDVGQKSGPEALWNPAYHEFICIKAGGKTICGGQTMIPSRRTGYLRPWGEGTPSKDYWDPRHCEKVSESQCMDACLQMAFDQPRPRYGLFGRGTNCQEWAERSYSDCFVKCREWK